MKLFAIIGIAVALIAIYFVARYLWNLHQDRVAQSAQVKGTASSPPPTAGVREPNPRRGAEEEVYPESDRVAVPKSH